MKSGILTVSLAASLLLMPALYGSAHEVTLKEKAPPAVTAERPAHEEEGIEAHMEEALELKLAPIRAELAEIHAEVERPGLAEIVGGIGWIVGILGSAAYVKSRRR